MRAVNTVDLIAGGLVLTVGAYFTIGALEYRIGSLDRMGPGFMPLSLGVVAVVLGVGILARAFRQHESLPEVAWRAALAVLGSVGLFAFSLPKVGLIPAVILTVLASSLAIKRSKKLETLMLALSISFVAWVLFVLLFGIPLHAFRMPL